MSVGRFGQRNWGKFVAAGLLGACSLLFVGCGANEEVVLRDFHDLAEPIAEATFAPGSGEDGLTGAVGVGNDGAGIGESGDGFGTDGAAGTADVGYDGAGSDGSGNGETTSGGSYGSGSGSLADGTEASGEDGTETGTKVVTFTVSAAGDCTLGTTHEQGSGAGTFDGEYTAQGDPAYFFSNVKDIFSADDCTIVNLEGPLTEATIMREGRTFNIKGKPEYVHILSEGAIESVGFSNNHRLDYLEQGSQDTMDLLEEEGIVYASETLTGMYEANGIKMGLIAVQATAASKYINDMIKKDIATLKEQGADLIVACIHWGTEREYFPEEYQMKLGRDCIDWGVDLVLGSHPHVLQGFEEYKGKFICYSLGNFCFGGNRNPSDKDTCIFQQTFTFVEGELQEDVDVRVIPCSVSSVSTRNDYCPTPAEGEEYDRILEKINSCSESFGVKFEADGTYLPEIVG